MPHSSPYEPPQPDQREVGALPAGGSPGVCLRQTGSHSPVRRPWEPATDKAGLLGPWPLSLSDFSSEGQRYTYTYRAREGAQKKQKKMRSRRRRRRRERERDGGQNRFRSQDSWALMLIIPPTQCVNWGQHAALLGASISPFLNGFLPGEELGEKGGLITSGFSAPLHRGAPGAVGLELSAIN